MHVRSLAGLTVRLHYRRQLLEPWVAQEDRELVADQPFADVRVAVAVRAERRLRVVHVERPQPVEPDQPIEVVEEPVQDGGVGDVVAGRPEVARVEADAEPGMAVEPLDECRELLERATDRVAGAGRVLEKEPGRIRATLEHLFERRNRPVEPGLEAGAEVGADVEDDAVGLNRTAGVDGAAQRRDRFLVDHVVGAREVAEVDGVDERGLDPGLCGALGVAREHLRVVVRVPPGPRALGEELEGVGADRLRPLRRSLDAAPDVAAEEHTPTIRAWPTSASVWLRAPPACSTSEVFARSCSTGSSPANATASSCCGSRTPTRAARSPRRRSRSSETSLGSASTGTATSVSSSTGWRMRSGWRGSWSRRGRPTRTRARSGSGCPTRGRRAGTT